MAAAELATVYRRMVGAAQRFESYNFREYFVRRAEQSLARATSGEIADPAAELGKAKKDLAQLERMATINGFYAVAPSAPAQPTPSR